MKPIAHVRTCYGEKFGAPRQPGLINEAWGELVFDPEFRDPDAVRGLEGFSHLWLVFVFHQTAAEGWKPTVRPPRLGGNKKVGVFASRSPFRPNPIGLSCVQLKNIDYHAENGPVLQLGGVDLVDGTPVLDIKPYIPYCDALPDAVSGFAPDPPELRDVDWQNEPGAGLAPSTRLLIERTLAIDPRPAYRDGDDERIYGCLIDGFNVQWTVRAGSIVILGYEER